MELLSSELELNSRDLVSELELELNCHRDFVPESELEWNCFYRNRN